jgi:hypothetical protein
MVQRGLAGHSKGRKMRFKAQMRKPIPKKRNLLGTWILAFIGGLMLGMATLHRLQLHIANPEAYMSNPITVGEVVLLPIILVLLAAYCLQGLYLLYKKQWRELGVVAVNVAIGVACLCWAMYIDSPTLVYRT